MLKLFALAIPGAAVAIALGASAAAPPTVDAQLRQAYGAKDLGSGHALPAVVARVGATDITSKDFSQRVAIARLTNTRQLLGKGDKQIQAETLKEAVRRTALLDRARSEGVAVTDAEVASYIRTQSRERAAVFARNPEALAAFNAMIAAEGIPSAAAFDVDPRTFQGVREAFQITRLIDNHVGATSTGEQRDAFVKETLAGAHVSYFIEVA